MGIVGLILAGGLLLLWVAWRMYRELRHAGPERGLPGGWHGDENTGLKPGEELHERRRSASPSPTSR